MAKFEEVLYEAEGALERLSKEGDKIGRSKVKGNKWCVKATPTLVSLAALRKYVEEARKVACKPLKDKVKLIEGPARQVLNMVELVDSELRNRVMEEYEGDGSIDVEDIGSLVFQEKWGYEVVDIGAVDPELLTVDKDKVMELIKGGVRNIGGIEVKKGYVLAVCQPGNKDYVASKMAQSS